MLPMSRTEARSGSPCGVRSVIPRPAATAAHSPDRLGLVNASRHEMPATSRAARPHRRKRQGWSSMTRGNAPAGERTTTLRTVHTMGSETQAHLSEPVCPLTQSDGHDAPGLIDELVPGRAAMLDEIVVRFEDAI